ncbi:LacI family transcriptional regulator [Neorhizobium huautlense]|uniref:LacI family transcriptional regulator n=1 Tax=Neorhizobium huautlense TaxID=67774 RepID=A0ABT9PNK7_9HYPH|nr:LacI family DNA-binding transcriptional regulator [Neorhizobium huautlense]MDP9836041.1 LacI family transcriptional regulator [Neorhizobium huautlense]
MKPTVHDIARSAGVSLATVDRVLNARPGVREGTRVKVEEAIAALGYVRDVAAANLAKSRVYPFVFILPVNENPFMAGLRREVEEAIARSGVERTRIEVIDVPALESAALVAALDKVAAGDAAGVAFVAVDAPDVREAAGRVAAAGIPMVTLVSDLSQSPRDHYAGIDNIAAGRTAATLMGRFLGARQGKIVPLAGSLMVRDHRERLEGFSAVMVQDFPHFTLLPAVEGRDDAALVEKLMGDVLRQHPDICGIYSLGAGNSGLLPVLEAQPLSPAPVVILHELTQATGAALQNGTIDAVLNQDAGHEVRSAIRVLKAKADGLPVIAAQERIRIDIFLKDNLP